MNDYFRIIMKTINESIEGLDMNSFDYLCEDICTSLRNGKKVVATGLGKNVPICEKFEGTMLSMGMNAMFLHTNTAIHGDIGAVCDGDIVIVLSKSGETQESIYLMEHLLKRDIIIWALTFKSGSSLDRMAHKSLMISMDHEGDKWNIVPNNSTTLNLIVLQAVAMEVADRMGVSLDDFRRNHPGGHIGVQLNV